MTTLVAIHTTLPDRDSAAQLARLMVTRRLAACAQIEAIESVYVWEGQLQHTPEHRVVFKTLASCQAVLCTAVRAHHPYEVPQILTLPVLQANEDYVDWVRSLVAPSTDQAAEGVPPDGPAGSVAPSSSSSGTSST